MEYTMRDDERYPVVIGHHDYSAAPELATSDAPEVVQTHHLHPDHFQEKYINQPADASGGSFAAEPASQPPQPAAKTICGLRRRNLIIIGIVVALVVVGAVVGGVVGGLAAKRAKASQAGSQIISQTGPIDASQRYVAAGTSSTTDRADIQFFYQDLTTTDILYQLVWQDLSKGEQRTSLPLRPTWGSPLAVTSSGTSPVTVNLFYMTATQSNISIAQAVLTCSPGASTCRTTSNQIISSNITTGVEPDSTLAALLLDGQSSIRVFFQSEGGSLFVLDGDNVATAGWTPQRLGGPALGGTGLAALTTGQGHINTFFVSNGSEQLKFVDYMDILGNDGGQIVDSTPGSPWGPTAKLAAAYTQSLDSYRVYYVAPSTGAIMSHYKNGENDTWHPNHDDSWGACMGGLAAVAWLDEVRLLYESNGRWAMSSQSNNTWSPIVYL